MVASQRGLTTKRNLCVFRSRMKYCCYARNTTDQALLQSQLELAFENTRSRGNLMVRTQHQLPFLFFPPPLNYVPFVVLSPGARCALQITASHQDQECHGIEVAARLILISTYLANLLAPI